MSFGSRLKELRIEKGFSQKEVAGDMGVSITTISQYESDSRFPNEDMLRRLCLYYKITSDYLLGLTDTKHAPLSKDEAKTKMVSSKQMELISELIDMIHNPEEKTTGRMIDNDRKRYNQ